MKTAWEVGGDTNQDSRTEFSASARESCYAAEVASSSLVGPATCHPRFPHMNHRFPSFFV